MKKETLKQVNVLIDADVAMCDIYPLVDLAPSASQKLNTKKDNSL